MPKRTRPYRDSLLEDLQDPVEAAEYLNAALEDSDEMFLVALRDVAEAKHMATVAVQVGVARETLYRMLSKRGNPTYNNLTGLLDALGVRMRLEPIFNDVHSGHLEDSCVDGSVKNSADKAPGKLRESGSTGLSSVSGYWIGERAILTGGSASRINARKIPPKRAVMSRGIHTRHLPKTRDRSITIMSGVIALNAA